MKTDTVDIDALYGEVDGSVTMPTLIWDQLIGDLGELPPRPHIEPFDEQPWQQLPTLEELSLLWGASPVFMLMGDIVSRLNVPDVPKFLAEQRFMAEIELAWTREAEYMQKEKEAQNAVNSEQEPHRAGSGDDEPVGVSDAGGGGGDFSGGSENGDAVGEGGQDFGEADRGRASQVPRRRRPGKTARRREVIGEPNTSADPQAAAAPEVHGDHGDVAGGGDGAGGAGDVPVAA